MKKLKKFLKEGILSRACLNKENLKLKNYFQVLKRLKDRLIGNQKLPLKKVLEAQLIHTNKIIINVRRTSI